MITELKPEEGIAGKFVKTAFDENGVLSKIEFTNDETFNFAFDVVPFDFIVLMFVLIAIIVSIIQYSILREDREISDASIDKSTLVNTPH